MTRADRYRIKLEAWRDSWKDRPELWLVLVCIAALLILAHCAGAQ